MLQTACFHSLSQITEPCELSVTAQLRENSLLLNIREGNIKVAFKAVGLMTLVV